MMFIVCVSARQWMRASHIEFAAERFAQAGQIAERSNLSAPSERCAALRVYPVLLCLRKVCTPHQGDFLRTFYFSRNCFHKQRTPGNPIKSSWNLFGCPLMGWLSDRIGRRKPVILGSIAVMILAAVQIGFKTLPIPVHVAMFIFGVASGAARIPYSIIKEVNPESVKGSAAGGINFLVFGRTRVTAITAAEEGWL
jgi:sugar transport protein